MRDASTNATAAGIEYLADGVGAMTSAPARAIRADAISAGADALASGLDSFAAIKSDPKSAPRRSRGPNVRGWLNAPVGLGVPG